MNTCCQVVNCEFIPKKGFLLCRFHKCSEKKCPNDKLCHTHTNTVIEGVRKCFICYKMSLTPDTRYCIDHKCGLAVCDQKKEISATFCKDHSCKEKNCGKATNKRYCTDHRCLVKTCTRRRYGCRLCCSEHSAICWDGCKHGPELQCNKYYNNTQIGLFGNNGDRPTDNMLDKCKKYVWGFSRSNIEEFLEQDKPDDSNLAKDTHPFVRANSEGDQIVSVRLVTYMTGFMFCREAIVEVMDKKGDVTANCWYWNEGTRRDDYNYLSIMSADRGWRYRGIEPCFSCSRRVCKRSYHKLSKFKGAFNELILSELKQYFVMKTIVVNLNTDMTRELVTFL